MDVCKKKKSEYYRGNIWPKRRWYASTRRQGGSGVQMRLEQVLPLPFCPGSFPAPSLLRKPQSKQRSGASVQSPLQSLPPTPRGASADGLSEPGRIPLIENHKGIRFLHPAYTVMHEKTPVFGCRVDSNGGQNGSDRVPTNRVVEGLLNIRQNKIDLDTFHCVTPAKKSCLCTITSLLPATC